MGRTHILEGKTYLWEDLTACFRMVYWVQELFSTDWTYYVPSVIYEEVSRCGCNNAIMPWVGCFRVQNTVYRQLSLKWGRVLYRSRVGHASRWKILICLVHLGDCEGRG